MSSASVQKKSRNPLKHTKVFYDFPQDNVRSPVRLNLRGLCLELINLCLGSSRDFKLFVVLSSPLEFANPNKKFSFREAFQIEKQVHGHQIHTFQAEKFIFVVFAT